MLSSWDNCSNFRKEISTEKYIYLNSDFPPIFNIYILYLGKEYLLGFLDTNDEKRVNICKSWGNIVL
jgi:hypothetical protein